jgi:hypothetical protein
MAVHVGEQEHAPSPSQREQHADFQRAGRAGATGDPGRPERGEAVDRARRTDVRVEVVSEPTWKKIACASAPRQG